MKLGSPEFAQGEVNALEVAQQARNLNDALRTLTADQHRWWDDFARLASSSADEAIAARRGKVTAEAQRLISLFVAWGSFLLICRFIDLGADGMPGGPHEMAARLGADCANGVLGPPRGASVQ